MPRHIAAHTRIALISLCCGADDVARHATLDLLVLLCPGFLLIGRWIGRTVHILTKTSLGSGTRLAHVKNLRKSSN